MNKAIVVIGGGAGVPPMYLLARRLLARGADVTVVLGFNAREEIFYEEEFRALGAGSCFIASVTRPRTP